MTSPGPSSCQGPVIDEVHVALTDDLQAPRAARRATRTALQRWRLPGLVDVVVLAVSELVSNAVRHGMPPVRLVLSRGPRGVRVEVHDEAQTEPPPRGPGAPEAAESGRGLDIVAAVSRSSGVEQVPDDGKVVYAAFDLPPEAR